MKIVLDTDAEGFLALASALRAGIAKHQQLIADYTNLYVGAVGVEALIDGELRSIGVLETILDSLISQFSGA